jgi:predicted Zn-ribbon and HTH transcriptional regulator
VPGIDDWRAEAKRVLMSFDFPIDIGDLCRLSGLSVDDVAEMYQEIANISKSLAGTQYALVVEEGFCVKCNRSARFTGNYTHRCERCGGFTTPPKVCINPR